jgi:hypothetical protein
LYLAAVEKEFKIEISTMLDVAEQGSGDHSKGNTPTKHQQAHLAGLKRLSARASAGPVTPPGTRRVFFSFSAYARSVIEKLRECEVPIAEGLSCEEFERIEATYGFTFPPDLRGILEAGLPVGAGFPNWRADSPHHLRMRINLPVVGLLHQVANSSFWWKGWGPRPLEIKQAVKIARSALRKSPILVPMYGHCYIPSSPNLAGNPVFFVYQKNAVYCGYDVADFFDRKAFLTHKFEFGDLMYDMGSFRNEKNLQGGHGSKHLHQSDLDFVHRSSNSSSGTDSSEASGSGASSGQGESWGRSLDVLAQHVDGLGSPRKEKLQHPGFARIDSNRSASRQLSFSRSFDHRSHEPDPQQEIESKDDIMNYPYIVEKPLPPKTLMRLSMVPWSSRSSRRIEFWSDLAAKVLKQLATRGDGFLSPQISDIDVPKPRLYPVKKLLEEKERHEVKSSKWLNGYLDEISVVLRQGGWREDEINDMIDSKSPSQRWSQQLDAQGVLASLAREVEYLSMSLKKAGWSVPDVAETMTMSLNALLK